MSGPQPFDQQPPDPDDRALAVLGRLTRGALHEIANPLLALTGTAELALADTEPGTKLRSRLEVVQTTGREIVEIVRALQAFARAQHDPVTRLALGDAAEEATSLVRRVSAVRDIELVVRRVDDVAVVAAPGDVGCALVQLALDGLAGAARGDVVELVVALDGSDAVAVVEGVGELRLEASP